MVTRREQLARGGDGSHEEPEEPKKKKPLRKGQVVKETKPKGKAKAKAKTRSSPAMKRPAAAKARAKAKAKASKAKASTKNQETKPETMKEPLPAAEETEIPETDIAQCTGESSKPEPTKTKGKKRKEEKIETEVGTKKAKKIEAEAEPEKCKAKTWAGRWIPTDPAALIKFNVIREVFDQFMAKKLSRPSSFQSPWFKQCTNAFKFKNLDGSSSKEDLVAAAELEVEKFLALDSVRILATSQLRKAFVMVITCTGITSENTYPIHLVQGKSLNKLFKML